MSWQLSALASALCGLRQADWRRPRRQWPRSPQRICWREPGRRLSSKNPRCRRRAARFHPAPDGASVHAVVCRGAGKAARRSRRAPPRVHLCPPDRCGKNAPPARPEAAGTARAPSPALGLRATMPFGTVSYRERKPTWSVRTPGNPTTRHPSPSSRSSAATTARSSPRTRPSASACAPRSRSPRPPGT